MKKRGAADSSAGGAERPRCGSTPSPQSPPRLDAGIEFRGATETVDRSTRAKSAAPTSLPLQPTQPDYHEPVEAIAYALKKSGMGTIRNHDHSAPDPGPRMPQHQGPGVQVQFRFSAPRYDRITLDGT